MFLIARVGAQIYDTGLVHPIDRFAQSSKMISFYYHNLHRNNTDVTFNDVLLFSKMPPYFELKLELYSFLLSDQSMVRHLDYKLSKETFDFKVGGTARFVQGAKSLSKAVGKKIVKTLRDHTNQVPSLTLYLSFHPILLAKSGFYPQENDDNVAREQRLAGPKFDLLATATLRLEEAGEQVGSLDKSSFVSSNIQVRSHEFYMEENENSLGKGGSDKPDKLPPMFGHFCCRLAVQPYCR